MKGEGEGDSSRGPDSGHSVEGPERHGVSQAPDRQPGRDRPARVRACHELGRAVVAYSEAERPLPVRLADEAVCIGPRRAARPTSTSPASSARPPHGRDAIHPGYGFLAENPSFAEISGHRWPSSARPRKPSAHGNKALAREIARQAGAHGPRSEGREPGQRGQPRRPHRLPGDAQGGGRGRGRGMRIVRTGALCG